VRIGAVSKIELSLRPLIFFAVQATEKVGLVKGNFTKVEA
jgi:hypothetical protein